ncbi:sure-like protein [Athelia psychrophila]|uniref:Sure-like protein n=1 Tax=Athelia psychrophila TaxID=1759441 RepID=A0A165YSA7_9AGAM|nr:sure-like protein [Fibularhizoctonia sp. CBS 109695]
MRPQNVLGPLLALASAAQSAQIVLTNDDGWAVAQIRAQKDALTTAGYNVILSAPAQDQSGSGSSSTTPFPPTKNLPSPCEYNSCPTGSPAEGFNASDPSLNYVNGYPVDSAKYGIQYLAPKLFNNTKPDLVVSGPNVGSNTGAVTLLSGTVGAACEAALEGIPALSISGVSTSEVSYTTLLSDPTSQATLAAGIYASLTVKLVQALLANTTTPILPPGIVLNVNYPATDSCAAPSDYKFVLSRIYWNPFHTDVETCGSTTLPTESSVEGTAGCYVSVSVYQASNKLDANATMQGVVLEKLGAC